MVAIARAESGWRVEAVGGPNSNGSYDRGLFQVNDIHGYDRGRLVSDAAYNTSCAKRIYDGQGLRAWSVYNSGAYQKYMNEARQGVAQAGNVSGAAAVPTAGPTGPPPLVYGKPGPEITVAGIGPDLRAAEDISGPLANFYINDQRVLGDFAPVLLGAPHYEAAMTTVPNITATIIDEDGGLLGDLGSFWAPGTNVTYEDLYLRMDQVKFEPGNHGTGQLSIAAADDIVYRLMNLIGPRTASWISATEWIAQELRLVGLDPNQILLGESVPTQSVLARDEADQSGAAGTGETPSAWTTIVRLAKELGKYVFISGRRLIFGSAGFAMRWAAPGAVRASYNGFTEPERFMTMPTVTRVSVGARQGLIQIEGKVPLARAKYFRPGARASVAQVPWAVAATPVEMLVTKIKHDIGTDTDGAEVTLLQPADPPPQPPQNTAAGLNSGPTSAGALT
jgi:hypothetical protein